ncbi:hypothetical protein LUZ60_008724 [Juncus effusus]|nr:hypothetical protein LUZ60_008724 [Juncus effusus]
MASSYTYGIDEEFDRINAHLMLLRALGQNPYASVNSEDEECYDVPEWSARVEPDFSNDSCQACPAARSVVAGLASAVRSKWDRRASGAPCAVCKEEISVGEKMTELPCTHFYHEDCIMPWLKVRNTCPLCRYELPSADDVDCIKCRD